MTEGYGATPNASRPGAWTVALTLVGLAILLPELLTGSTPVRALLNPVGDLFLLGLYGGGVLLVREVAVRRQLSWPSVLLLGGAYGILEEAIGTKTFFDPVEVHNTFPAPWGHFLGVNWVWAVELTTFHAVFSIALPILVVGLLYPAWVGRPLLTRRSAPWIGGAFVTTVAVMFFAFDPRYALSPWLVLGALGCVLSLIAAAVLWPVRALGPVTDRPTRSPRTFAIAGGLYVWLFFGVNWLVGAATQSVLLTVVLQMVLGALFGRWLVHNAGRRGNGPQMASLVLGLVSFLLVLTVVLEFVGDVGSLVAVGFAIFVLYRLERSPTVASPALKPDAVGL